MSRVGSRSAGFAIGGATTADERVDGDGVGEPAPTSNRRLFSATTTRPGREPRPPPWRSSRATSAPVDVPGRAAVPCRRPRRRSWAALTSKSRPGRSSPSSRRQPLRRGSSASRITPRAGPGGRRGPTTVTRTVCAPATARCTTTRLWPSESRRLIGRGGRAPGHLDRDLRRRRTSRATVRPSSTGAVGRAGREGRRDQPVAGPGTARPARPGPPPGCRGAACTRAWPDTISGSGAFGDERRVAAGDRDRQVRAQVVPHDHTRRRCRRHRRRSPRRRCLDPLHDGQQPAASVATAAAGRASRRTHGGSRSRGCGSSSS